MEKDYKYEKFLTDIGDKLVLPNHISQYIYEVSFACSKLVQNKMGNKFKEIPMKLEESI